MPGSIDHAEAFGRIAFSCPRAEVNLRWFHEMISNEPYTMQLPGIEAKVKEAGGTILTPLVSLDTPGKATVEVVILADPVSFSMVCIFGIILLSYSSTQDGHEICFVGDEAFRELSQPDPTADDLINKVSKRWM